MATPRKHWCRLYDSILREDWDAQTGWTVVRLMAWLNQRWARDGIPHSEAGRAVLGPLDMMLITGRRRSDIARTSLEHLRDVLDISAERRGDNLAIDWPKFPELQEYSSRSPGSDSPEISPSENSPRREEKKEKNSAKPTGGKRRSPLLNALSKLDGDELEKQLWLAENGPQIEVDAIESKRTGRPQTALQITIRYYRAYLRRGGREFRRIAELERAKVAIAARNEETRAERERIDAEMANPPPETNALLDSIFATGAKPAHKDTVQ